MNKPKNNLFIYFSYNLNGWRSVANMQAPPNVMDLHTD